MSNICNNELHVQSEHKENIQYVKTFIDNNFHCFVDEIDDDYLCIEFDSSWDFPIDEMYELYKGLPFKDDINMTCLSVDWGCFYCQFHTCDKDGWSAE